MLRVLFQMGEARYALDSRDVHEVVPLVRFRTIPGAPDYVCGVFLYRGRVVPVIDLSRLAGAAPARLLMSTRIILVKLSEAGNSDRLLGLLAEKAVDTLKKDRIQTQKPGLVPPSAEWLGNMITEDGQMAQEIDVRRLLPDSVRELIFREEAVGT